MWMLANMQHYKDLIHLRIIYYIPAPSFPSPSCKVDLYVKDGNVSVG